MIYYFRGIKDIQSCVQSLLGHKLGQGRYTEVILKPCTWTRLSKLDFPLHACLMPSSIYFLPSFFYSFLTVFLHPIPLIEFMFLTFLQWYWRSSDNSQFCWVPVVNTRTLKLWFSKYAFYLTTVSVSPRILLEMQIHRPDPEQAHWMRIFWK